MSEHETDATHQYTPITELTPPEKLTIVRIGKNVMEIEVITGDAAVTWLAASAERLNNPTLDVEFSMEALERLTSVALESGMRFTPETVKELMERANGHPIELDTFMLAQQMIQNHAELDVIRYLESRGWVMWDDDDATSWWHGQMGVQASMLTAHDLSQFNDAHPEMAQTNFEAIEEDRNTLRRTLSNLRRASQYGTLHHDGMIWRVRDSKVMGPTLQAAGGLPLDVYIETRQHYGYWALNPNGTNSPPAIELSDYVHIRPTNDLILPDGTKVSIVFGQYAHLESMAHVTCANNELLLSCEMMDYYERPEDHPYQEGDSEAAAYYFELYRKYAPASAEAITMYVVPLIDDDLPF
jgi:hypothetical protein